MSKSNLRLEFISHNRQATCAPNPRYPSGIDIDMAEGKPSCSADLPYPAECCGAWLVRCMKCGFTTAITTAGLVDDPRSVKLPCGAGRKSYGPS